MNVKYQLALCWGFFLVFAADPTKSPAALTPEKLYQRVLPSVMTLEVESQSGEKFVGSAVLAMADDVAVTAWHVVANARTVWAVFADGQRLKVIGCLHQDALRDLALLKLARPPLPWAGDLMPGTASRGRSNLCCRHTQGLSF